MNSQQNIDPYNHQHYSGMDKFKHKLSDREVN